MSGWLLFVSVLMGGFYPLSYALSIARVLDGRDYRNLPSAQGWALAVVAFFGIWSAAAGFGLATSAPEAKEDAERNLGWSLFLCSAVALYMGSEEPALAGVAIRLWLSALALFGLPLLYLRTSKRVAATFPERKSAAASPTAPDTRVVVPPLISPTYKTSRANFSARDPVNRLGYGLGLTVAGVCWFVLSAAGAALSPGERAAVGLIGVAVLVAGVYLLVSIRRVR